MKKLKFESSGFGGNMEALEATYKGYQILISDNFGSAPEKGGEFGLSIYKWDKEMELWETEPAKRIEGKRYSLQKATERAIKLVDGLEAKRQGELRKRPYRLLNRIDGDIYLDKRFPTKKAALQYAQKVFFSRLGGNKKRVEALKAGKRVVFERYPSDVLTLKKEIK